MGNMTEQLNNKFLAVLGLCHAADSFSSCGDQGLLSGQGAGASITDFFFVVEHGLTRGSIQRNKAAL